MTFEETSVAGAFVVELELIGDDRGFFARSWCSREFADRDLHAVFVQENVGFSTQAGTLRGFHFQEKPFDEVKLVRCTAGSVWDVAVDVRPASPTYRRWTGVELNAERRNMLYVPAGCAHGYLTLTDDTEIRYLTSQFYEPSAASGVRFDDPFFGVDWPAEIRKVSEHDRAWPLRGLEDAKGVRS